MTLKEEILALKDNSEFSRIYAKWRMRKHRNPKLTLEMVQKASLMEFKETMEKHDTQTNDEEPDYMVRVGGRAFSNREWKDLMKKQAFLANTDLNPSPCWEDLTTHYLQRMFIEDRKKPRKDKAVDLWDE